MISVLCCVALLATGALPYAPDSLIFQSTESVKRTIDAFDETVDADIERFKKLCRQEKFDEAYDLWSDLVFRSVSLGLEVMKTVELTTNAKIKIYVGTQHKQFLSSFQEKFFALFPTFLQNAKGRLSPQQSLITASILKEHLETHPQEASKITPLVQKLETSEKKNFARFQGRASPLQSFAELKVLTANVLCFPGKLTYTYGGIRPWKERITQLSEMIRKTQAEIVCLQEVWDPEAMRALRKHLTGDYAYFIENAGDPAGTLAISKMGYNSGLFIASKVPLDEVTFERYPRSIPQTSNRGVLIVSCRIRNEQLTFINTHLQHGNTAEMQEIRKEQLHLCYDYIQKAASTWSFVAGDLNVNAFLPEFKESGIAELFLIPYVAHISNEADKATCTEYFNDLVLTPFNKRNAVPVKYELLDYCVRPTNAVVKKQETQKLIPLFSIKEPASALSDHHGLLTTFNLSLQ